MIQIVKRVSVSKWLNFVLSLVLLFLTSCQVTRSTTGKGKVEDFDKFYDKFHMDMTFQKSRLRFPLEGHDEFGKVWTNTNWQLMKSKVYDVDKSQYKVDIKKTATSFFQKVWIEGSGFSSECRFQLIKGKWYLVYALEQNS